MSVSFKLSDFCRVDETGAVVAFPLDTLQPGASRIIKIIRDKRVILTVKSTKDKPDGEEILDASCEYELYDKVKSLELLSRHLGLLHDKAELGIVQPINIVIKKFSAEHHA